MGSGANRAEGDGLGSHPARRHERVEATAHVRAPVTRPFGAAAVNRTCPLKDPVHEDLPHEDDPAHPGIGGRGRGGCLGRSGLARTLSLGGRGRARGRLVSRTQLQQLEGDGRQVQVGGEFDLGEAAADEDLEAEGCAQDGARDRADRVGVPADVGSVQQRLRRGVAREQREGHGNRLRRCHGRAHLLDQAFQG